MSLLTTTSLIVVWCMLEVVDSNMVIPQSPVVNQFGVSPPYQINNTYQGIQDGEDDSNNKEGKNPYKMFYIEKDQFRCEECDEKGNIRGNMTYVDGKHNAIRTVKYETKDIPLDPSSQETGAQSSFSGAQDPYQQQQYIQGQQFQSTQGQQMYQGQQLGQVQQLQPIIPGQLQTMVQPQQGYQGQPMQAQGQSYQGNQPVYGPLNSNYQQQNPIAPQLPVPLMASNNQPPQGAALIPSNLGGNNQYASAASTSFPFSLERSLPEAVSPGVFGVRPVENRASSANNQGLTGLTSAGGYPTIDALAAEAIRNLQPQPTQLATIQQSVPDQTQQSVQPQVLNDNGFGSLARRFNFINSNGVDDRPQGPSILSSPSYQQPLFSTTSTGVMFNREPSGAYNFEYKTPDSSRKEVADAKNNVMGSYAYRDPSGGIHNVEYNSGLKGFSAREQSISGAPTPAVMPAMILVPTQQPGSVLGQQVPFTLVAAGNSPLITASNVDSPIDKISKDEDSAKPSDTEMTESMLQKLAKHLVDKMAEEKSGPLDENISSQPTVEGEQPGDAR